MWLPGYDTGVRGGRLCTSRGIEAANSGTIEPAELWYAVCFREWRAAVPVSLLSRRDDRLRRLSHRADRSIRSALYAHGGRARVVRRRPPECRVHSSVRRLAMPGGCGVHPGWRRNRSRARYHRHHGRVRAAYGRLITRGRHAGRIPDCTRRAAAVSLQQPNDRSGRISRHADGVASVGDQETLKRPGASRPQASAPRMLRYPRPA